MNTIRKCDWSEVKPGEVFVIHKQTKEFQNLGMWEADGTALTIKGGYVQNYMNGNNVLAAPGSPYYRGKNVEQLVEVIEKPELGLFERFKGKYLNRPNNTTGADPEIFVVRGKKPSLLPAYRFLPTQKDAKTGKAPAQEAKGYAYVPTGYNSYAYRDGFAAEYYVHPLGCHSYVIDYVREGLIRVINAAKAHDASSKLTIKNTFTIPAVTMNAAKDEDIAFGCMPSINAYGDTPIVPKDPRKFKLRFAGGHIHLGCAALSKEKALDMVKAADILAAIPAVAMFSELDTPVRRQYYGRAGEYRLPAHGLEYRVLSNAWLCAPAISHLLFNLVRIGGKVGYSGKLKDLCMNEQEVRDIINFCDVKAARKFCEKNEQLFINLLIGDGAHTNAKAWLKVTQEGVESLYKDVDDLITNWHIEDKQWATHSEGPKCDWGKMCRSLV